MILHVTAPLKRLDVHLSKQHRCSEEKQEDPSPGHCDAPFQRHLAPAAFETNKRSGGWLPSLQPRGCFGMKLMHWVNWLVGCGGNSSNLGVTSWGRDVCSNSFSMSWFWHQLWAKTIPKRKRFGDVFSRNTNGNLEENHGKNGEGGGVTVWSCDKSVSVCTHRSSGEGFQKHLHKHKVVSEKSRKYTLCTIALSPAISTYITWFNMRKKLY